jgi:hypothetical protein
MALTTAAAILGAAAIGGVVSASASNKAAKTQAAAATTAAQSQERAAALAVEAQRTGSAEAVAAAREAAATAQQAQNEANFQAQNLERLRYNEARMADERAFTGAQEAATKGFDAAQSAYDTSFGAARAASDLGFDTALADATRGFDTALTDINRGYDASQAATELGYNTARGDFEQAYQRQGEFQDPYIKSGLTAQEQIMQLMGIGGDANAANYGQYARSFGMGDFEQDPGYAFRQSEGLKGLDRSASARGGILSGSALKNIQRFGQDLASQEYQNAFNRYQTERAARLNTLGGLSSAGQSAANVMTGAAGQLGSNNAANALARAQATSANSIGRGTATGNIAMNRGATTGNIAMNRGAATSANVLGLGQATAGTALGRANAESQNLMDRAAAAKANDAAYYGNIGNLTLARGQNTAQNAYNVANAVSGGAMNLANAASQGAYNIGNAQATGATNAAAARASGYVGQANALNNAIGQIGGYYANAPMNNAMIAYYQNNSPSTARTAAAAPSTVMQGYNPFAYNPDRTI